MMSLTDTLKARPQYLLPGHLLSRLVYAAARVRFAPFKNLLIGVFSRIYRVKMEEAAEQHPQAYEHFNAFFTRALLPESRPVIGGARKVACPVDGTVSQAGGIDRDALFQAKGHSYTVTELLGGEPGRAAPFDGGRFATLYLAPSNYHRIHMPLDGRLTEMVHVPGRLFSVSPATARTIPRLFARNERVAALFDTAYGPMALVFVGAIFVASIETVWAGQVTPPAGRVVRRWTYTGKEAPRFKKGDEIGRFNMGSTVIVLFGPDAVRWADEIRHGDTVRMGQHLADVTGERKSATKKAEAPKRAVSSKKAAASKKATSSKKAAPSRKAASSKKATPSEKVASSKDASPAGKTASRKKPAGPKESLAQEPSQGDSGASGDPHLPSALPPMLEGEDQLEGDSMETSKWERHRPEEPEHVACEVCLKEISASTAQTAEGTDYLYHFCGVECLDKWKAKKHEEEDRVDHPKDV